MAELGSLSSGAKMAMKVFVKGVFTIFAPNETFLRVIANLQFNSVKYAMYTYGAKNPADAPKSLPPPHYGGTVCQ